MYAAASNDRHAEEGRRSVHPGRLLQHAQPGVIIDLIGLRDQGPTISPRALHVHPPRQRHQPGQLLRAVAPGQPHKDERFWHAPRAGRLAPLQHAGPHLNLFSPPSSQQPVHARDPLQHPPQERRPSRASWTGSRRTIGWPSQTSANSVFSSAGIRSLRAHPEAGASSSSRRSPSTTPRGGRILLHAPGRQMP